MSKLIPNNILKKFYTKDPEDLLKEELYKKFGKKCEVRYSGNGLSIPPNPKGRHLVCSLVKQVCGVTDGETSIGAKK